MFPTGAILNAPARCPKDEEEFFGRFPVKPSKVDVVKLHGRCVVFRGP